MMDHRSLKSSAAAVFAFNPIQAGTVAIATILRRRRIVGLIKQLKHKPTMQPIRQCSRTRIRVSQIGDCIPTLRDMCVGAPQQVKYLAAMHHAI
jgi:hypothetical protein